MKPLDSLERCFWFSSGTAGLVTSLRVIGVEGKWVAVPPNICPNILAAIIAAGGKPWFVDIEEKMQGMDPERLSEIVDGVAAVIAVHAYGMPCRIVDIVAMCRQRGVPVIEDCAQADGASVSGRDVGSFGDLALFSFGAGKIIDAGGGGMVAVNNVVYEQPMSAIVSRLNIELDCSAGENLSGVYRYFYNTFYPDKTTWIEEAFFALVKTLAPHFASRCPPARIPVLVAARKRRQGAVLLRRQKYQSYIDKLDGEDRLLPVPLHEGAAPWRFNVLIDANSHKQVFRQLLSAGVKASTWYPRMPLFIPSYAYRATALPVAMKFERKLLNLWIDEATTEETIAHGCSLLKLSLRNLNPEL